MGTATMQAKAPLISVSVYGTFTSGVQKLTSLRGVWMAAPLLALLLGPHG